MWRHFNVILENSDITKHPWQRLAISDNWNLLSAYVIWNILVSNIKGKVNKIAINGFIDLKIYIDLGLRPRSIYIYRSINQCIDLNGRLYLYNIYIYIQIINQYWPIYDKGFNHTHIYYKIFEDILWQEWRSLTSFSNSCCCSCKKVFE